MTARRVPAGLFVAAIFITSLLLLTSAFAAPGDFLYQWGSQQHLLDPEGVAVDSAGNVYVTDTDRVQVFNAAGVRIRQWGSFGAGEGQMKYPARLTVDATGRVYIADAGNARIDVFDTSGNFIGQWGYDGWATNPPLAVLSDGKGKVYVLESGMYDSTGYYFEGGVRVFDSEGNFLRDLGSIGSGPGQYKFAGGIALDAGGNVYVLDNGNSRVLEFNSSGTFVKVAIDLAGLYGRDIAIDSTGNFYIAGGYPYDDAVWIYDSAGTLLRAVRFSELYDTEHFWQPKTVAVDAKGNIYTLDLGNDGLRVFNNAGTPLSQWWSYGAALGQMSRPTGIAVDSAGRVYETDADDPANALVNDRVQVFSGTGTPIARWTGPFCQTSGITVDSSGNIQVLDTVDPTGMRDCQPQAVAYTFDPSGNLIGQWGDPNPNGLILNPFVIAQDPAGRFLVTDSTTSTVRVYDTAGNFLRSFGSFGAGSGQFNNPKGIAVDAAGNIYVADSGNGRVQVFNSAFTFIRKWGSSGFSNGFFRNPSAIAVDASGHVFVADTGNNRIQVFDSAGTFLKKWGGEGDENGQFRQPGGIALDRTGSKVYVADTGNNRIEVFQGYGGGDGTAPTVTAFVVPATSSSLTVPINTFTATDNVGVTGYLVNENPAKPAASASGWSATPPASYTFAGAGVKTLFAWAKDAAGNVSNSLSATVSVTGLPAPWLTQDIGTVGLTGSASYLNGVFTVKGGGTDIWGNADGFRFVYKAITGDGTVIARVTSLQNTNAYAKGGVMIRQSLASNSVHAAMVLTPINGAQFLRRTTAGGPTSQTTRTGVAAPRWVRLVRSGSTFTASISSDGVAWSQVGSSTIAMTGTVYVGLAVSSHNTGALCTATFDSVTSTGGDATPPTVTAFAIPATSSSLTVPITTLTASDDTGVTGYLVNESSTKPSATASGWSATKPASYSFTSTGTKILYAWAEDAAGNVSNGFPASVTINAGALPAPWLTQDIGTVGLTGSASYANGVFTIKGAGTDIWGNADGFRFVYKTMTGDGTIVARVTSQQNTNSYAKAGVMIRQALTPGSVHATMVLTPVNGAQFLRRTAAGGSTSVTARTGIAAPYWVKLVRSGSTFIGSVSADGVTWVQVGTATVSMTGTVYIGMDVSSHNTGVLSTATFDHL